MVEIRGATVVVDIAWLVGAIGLQAVAFFYSHTKLAKTIATLTTILETKGCLAPVERANNDC